MTDQNAKPEMISDEIKVEAFKELEAMFAEVRETMKNFPEELNPEDKGFVDFHIEQLIESIVTAINVYGNNPTTLQSLLQSAYNESFRHFVKLKGVSNDLVVRYKGNTLMVLQTGILLYGDMIGVTIIPDGDIPLNEQIVWDDSQEA